MEYMPMILGGTPVKRIRLASGKHTALLLDDIESKGAVKFRFILAVFDDETRNPCLFVTSEVNGAVEELGGGSHFLCLFSGDAHLNLGSSDDWADIRKFEEAAVKIATERLSESS